MVFPLYYNIFTSKTEKVAKAGIKLEYKTDNTKEINMNKWQSKC